MPDPLDPFAEADSPASPALDLSDIGSYGGSLSHSVSPSASAIVPKSQASEINFDLPQFQGTGRGFSRFTRTPTVVSDRPMTVSNFPTNTDVSAGGGLYSHDTAYAVTSPVDPLGSWTLRHEQIHAALQDIDLPAIHSTPEVKPSYDAIDGHWSGPFKNTLQRMILGGGQKDTEVPAYMLVHEEGQPTSATKEQREAYLSAFLGQLDKTNPAKAKLVRRIARIPEGWK